MKRPFSYNQDLGLFYVDEDFDFEQTMRDIHTELADLNKEAGELAAKIQKNFEELGI
jgi:type I restriction enzyme M protein